MKKKKQEQKMTTKIIKRTRLKSIQIIKQLNVEG